MEKTSRKRDMKDTTRLLDAQKQRNLFASDTYLRGLVNGVLANEGVNMDKGVRLIVESKVGEHYISRSIHSK